MSDPSKAALSCWYVGQDRRLPDGSILRAEILSPKFAGQVRAAEALAVIRQDRPAAYMVELRLRDLDPVRRSEFAASLR